MDASLIAIPACAVLMAVKGGQHGFLVNKYRAMHPVINRLLDGKVLSTLGFMAVAAFFFPWWTAILGGIGWLSGVAPSIGEDIEAQRNGNWRGTLQRGVFLGAMIALFLWSPVFIISGATMCLCLWISDRIDKNWWPMELLLGGAIGAGFLLS